MNSKPELPTDRRFGLVFSGIGALIAMYGVHRGWTSQTIFAAFAAASGFALAGLFAPGLLAPLNRTWFKLGQLLGRVVSPIVLGIMFFLIISPVAIVTRAFGRDPLRLKPRTTGSYWIDRTPAGPAPDSFKQQF